MEQREVNAQRFIEEHVYRLYASKIRVVGFKIFYPQLEDAAYNNLLHYVLTDPAIRVIHLRRNNQLRVLLSTKIAKRTGERTETSIARAEAQMKGVSQVELTYEECLKHFTIVSEYIIKYDDVLKEQGRRVLDVEYEAVVADPHSEFGRIQTFLGLEPQALSAPLVKQNNRSMAGLIKNYGELKRCFAGSPWAVYFDE